MKSILVAIAVLVAATPALAGNGGYKKPRAHAHGYHHGNHWNNHGNNNWNNRGNNNRYYNQHNTYNYKYNDNNNGWYAFGGFLGGLAVGGAIAEPGYGGAYYYDQPEAPCTTIFERRWNAAYQEWENIPHTVCGGY